MEFFRSTCAKRRNFAEKQNRINKKMKGITNLRLKLRDRFERVYTEDLVRISRVRRAKQIFPLKEPQSLPLTDEQKKEISSYWKQYRNVDGLMHWFAFYNASCKDKTKLKYYVPDGVYFSEIDTVFTSPRRSEQLDDKNLYDLFFKGVKMPRTVMRIQQGELFDGDYQLITLDQAVELCREAGQVVCKVTRDSAGGHGVYFFDFPDTSVEDFKQWLIEHKNIDINVQEVIQQHESLNKIHASSINSIRIMSLLLDGKVHILSSILRMGINGTRVDNASSGGIMSGVSIDGQLGEYAYDERGNRWSVHPQGTVFKDTKIVGVDKCCDVIRSVAGRMCSASKLISWDFTVGPDGEPILIEVNLTYGGVVIHQLCNGPIFGDMTDEMLTRIYKKK